MKKILSSLLILNLGLIRAGEPITINVSNSGYDHHVYEAGEAFPDTADIVFTSGTKLPRYDESLKDKGLTFHNGLTSNINHRITSDKNGGAQALYSAPVISVIGDETILVINDTLRADNGEAYPAINLWEGGHFVLGENAYVDLIAHSYYTRQLWVWSDGSGVFEIADGFVADHTEKGTSPTGLGSLRLNNCTIITHHTASLPLGYRPLIDPENNLDSADINAHFVFERDSGSVWSVNTHPQDYRGGLWADASMTIETNTDLTISGVKTVTRYDPGGPYTNWGGVLIKEKQTIRKRGREKLILSGDHGYQNKAKLIIDEGLVELQSDPFTYLDNAGYTVDRNGSVTSPNLQVIIKDHAKAHFNTPLSRIDSIAIDPMGEIQIGISAVLQTRHADWNGTLRINIPDGLHLQSGDEFHLLQTSQGNGAFTSVELEDFSGAIQWDLSELYTNGIISVASGEVHSSSEEMPETNRVIALHPNPARENLCLIGNIPANTTFSIYKLSGQFVKTGRLDKPSQCIPTGNMSQGIYLLQINRPEESRAWQKTFVVE